MRGRSALASSTVSVARGITASQWSGLFDLVFDVQRCLWYGMVWYSYGKITVLSREIARG
jgi:hypothetical protein